MNKGLGISTSAIPVFLILMSIHVHVALCIKSYICGNRINLLLLVHIRKSQVRGVRTSTYNYVFVHV